MNNHIPFPLFWGLLLFFFFEYIRPGSYFPFLESLKMNTIVPLALFTGTLISQRGTPQKVVLQASTTKWLSFYMILFVIQVPFVDVKFYVFEAFKAMIGYLLIYYVIIRQVTDIVRMRLVLTILVLIHVLLIILNPNMVLQPEVRNYVQGVTFLGDGNDFAWSLCIVVPFALHLFQKSKYTYIKIIWGGIFLLLVFAVIGTQSRGGTLALVGSILYLVIRAEKKTLGLTGVVVLIAMSLIFAPQAYFERMNSIIHYQEEGSALGRISAWNSAMRMAADHPFTGVGAGHFAVKYGTEYRPPNVGRTEIPWSTAHSMYFLALGEFGIPGLIILLGLILTNALRNERIVLDEKREYAKKMDRSRGLIVSMQASLIGFAVAGAFLSGSNYPHLYILTALNESARLIILSEYAKEENI